MTTTALYVSAVIFYESIEVLEPLTGSALDPVAEFVDNVCTCILASECCHLDEFG